MHIIYLECSEIEVMKKEKLLLVVHSLDPCFLMVMMQKLTQRTLKLIPDLDDRDDVS